MSIIRELARKWNEWLRKLDERLIFAFILLVGLFIAIGSGVIFYDEDTQGDENYYYQSAVIVKAEPLGWLDEKQIGISESLNSVVQGYSMLLPGNDFKNVYLIQIILYALTGLLIYRLSRFLLGRQASLVVLVFYWINNKHWLHVYNFKPGIWAIFLVTLCLYVVFKVISRPDRWQQYLWLGISSALLLLADLRYLPHLLLMYFILLFTKLQFWSKVKYLAVSGFLLIVLLIPWTIRQYNTFDKFIIISDINMLTIDKALNTAAWNKLSVYDNLAELSDDQFGARFFDISDSLGLTPGELIYARHQAIGKMVKQEPQHTADKYADVLKSTDLSVSDIEKEIAIQERKPFLWKVIRRAGFFWEPFRTNFSYDPLTNEKYFYAPTSKLNNLNRFVTLGLMVPFLIIGLLAMFRQARMVYALVILSTLLAHSVVHALTYVQWRYMLPLLPLITLAGIYGVRFVFRTMLHNNKQPANNQRT